jgi:hypothetical protein
MITKEQLIESAQLLQQPPKAAANEFEQAKDRLASILNERMIKRPDLAQLIGQGNQAMMEDNSRNMTLFMGSLFRLYVPETLVDTALWVFRAYRAHGFKVTYWPANLETYVEILREELTAETYAAIAPFFEWLIDNIPAFKELSDAELAADPFSRI